MRLFRGQTIRSQAIGRNSSTVQLHERLRPAWAEIVNSAGDQLLSRTCLTVNQHSGFCRRNGFDMLEDAAKHRALADDLLKVGIGAYFILQIEFFLGELVL